MNDYENSMWDEGDSSNWLEENLDHAYTTAWQGFGLPAGCLWDEGEE